MNNRMPYRANTWILAISLLALASCASNKPPQGNAVFGTRITHSGLKHFQLELRRNRSIGPDIEIRRQSGQRQRSGSGRENKNSYEKLQKQLLAFAEAEVEQSQYCREGFWVLKNEADAINPYMRGECNDQATPEDRQSFPDTIKNW